MRKTHRVTLPSKQKTKVVKKKASTTAKAKKKKQQPAKPKQHPRKKEKASAPSARANRMQLKNAAAPDAKSILEEKKQILNHRRKLLAYVRMSRTAAEERVNNLSDEECKQLEAVADPLEGTPKTDDASLEEPTTQNPQSSTVGLDASSSTNVELTTTKRPEELTKNEKHLKHQAALQNAATSKAKKKKTKKKKEKKTSTNRGITQRPSGKWQAQIFYAGKSRYLGVYDTEQAAALSFERASAFLQNIPETKNKVVIEHNVKLARNAAKTIGAL